MKRNKAALFVVLAVAIAAGTYYVARPQPVAVETTSVSRGILKVTVVASGKARARNRATISAPVDGQLSPSGVRSGDRLKQGHVLATIMPNRAPLLDARTQAERIAHLQTARATREEARAAVDRARVADKRAQSELERTQKLVAAKVLGRAELERMEFEAEQAAEGIRAAELALSRSVREVTAAEATLQSGERGAGAGRLSAENVLAPTDCVVLRVLEESSRPVSAGTALIEIAPQELPEAIVDLPTIDAIRIHAGARVDIEHWGGTEVLKGIVRMREGSAFTKVSPLGVEEQRVRLVVDPAPDSANNAWAQLEDGYYVEAKIAVSERSNVLKVSLGALFRKDVSWATFSIRGGETVLRRVEIGEMNGIEAEVLTGLADGERVVKYPSDELAEGVKVRMK